MSAFVSVLLLLASLLPLRGPDRRIDFPAGLHVSDDPGLPLSASVYSLPSAFFDADAALAFLSGVRKAAPDRDLIVLTDGPLKRALEERGSRLKLRLLDTHGRPFSPWPRDPFSLTRDAAGAVRIVVRPNVQPGREEDVWLGPELAQGLPDDLDRAWGGVAWTEAPIPFHNGQILFTRDAAWITLHSQEPRILALLGIDRVPVETFSTPAGVDRYAAAARKAAAELESFYGRPVRFVHPLPEPGGADGPALMRKIGGGAGYDLDSLVTLLPGSALVADLTAGRDLLEKMGPRDWKALRDGYGLEADGDALRRLLKAAQATPAASGLDAFLDLTADHLAGQKIPVRRLPLLLVPVALLRDREGLSHREFLLTWNNVVVETRAGRLRAEGFSSLLPMGDRRARDAFAAGGATLDLVPPLIRSVILNGGYRCASNHVRAAPSR